MLIIAESIEEIRARHERVVGFFGAPPREVLLDVSHRHDAALVDLDVDYRAMATKTVPHTYCHIIRNCVDNALALGSALVSVVAATGKTWLVNWYRISPLVVVWALGLAFIAAWGIKIAWALADGSLPARSL